MFFRACIVDIGEFQNPYFLSPLSLNADNPMFDLDHFQFDHNSPCVPARAFVCCRPIAFVVTSLPLRRIRGSISAMTTPAQWALAIFFNYSLLWFFNRLFDWSRIKLFTHSTPFHLVALFLR